MKILFLTNLYPPYVRGGAEYLGTQVVEELVRQGHQVAVVTSVPWRSVKKLKPELREEGGVEVYRFYPLNLYHYLTASKLLYPVRFLWQLINLWNPHTSHVIKKIVQQFKPELAISFNLMGLGFNVPRVLAVLKISHIHVLHDVQLLHPSGLFMWGESHRTLPMKIYQAITSWLFAPVKTVVSPSSWLLQEHIRAGLFTKAEQKVLPNPVPPFLALAHTKTTEAPLQLLFVGQFEIHKGVFWLVETIKQELKQRNFVLHLVALGQKPRVAELKALVAEDKRFVIHDIISQTEIDELYQSSHLSVIPSLCYENSPTAITKSLSAGTPVLAVNLGGIPELIIEDKTGWLYSPGDRADFAQKLSWCLKHPAELLQAGLIGSRVFADRTLEKYASDLVGSNVVEH
ncbi:MAG: Glycosyltransferase [Parcubacteria group bacterium GW2011_GWD1_42_9]|nr:MAG: Glycosyltransferase [Parcubacteria group bacterium GW2011_GWD1_42_9]